MVLIFATFCRNYSRNILITSKMSTYVSSELIKAICEHKAPPPPDFIQHREDLWRKLVSDYKSFVSSQPRIPIQVTLPDGKIIEGKSWETTPLSIACSISKGLADATVVARVNGELWDLERPFETNSSLELLKFDHKDGQYVFWHSSAHVLGEALELYYHGKLCYGPPIEEGFYYDMHSDGKQVRQDEYQIIDKLCSKIISEKQPFERLEVSKEDLLKMFEYNQFKCRILNERVTTPTTLIYKCGPLIDLCRGPHVRHTGCIKSMMVTKSSASYWEGKAEAESLQRVYGISFPNEKQLKEWKKLQEEAAKRDHRKLGIEQKLFFFHELSPGSCFFLPAGAHIYNKLVEFIKEQYWQRGFTEVMTPNLYNTKLWETSGHWQHYSENMFKIEVEKQAFALKPMNCPGHCLMFAHTTRSHRELPLRMADFGVLHRNEYSGALTGLTRVRRFQQDDAHIFCREDQIKEEITGCIDFLKYVYGIFGFTFELFLSTRPEKFLGDIEIWNKAEQQLEESLNASGFKWNLNPQDGAFYGPKIDITICDALKRKHQCATIQLDFQLPERFDLTYQMEDLSHTIEVGDGENSQAPLLSSKMKRPVMIHRAILGSVERMIAILTESYGGKWPFWLSPRQCLIVPVVSSCDTYAQSVRERIHDAGFMVDIDCDPGRTLNKKIRNGQLSQYNFILVVGEKEIQNESVNVRTRDNSVHGEHSVDHVITRFKALAHTKTREAEAQF